MRIPGIPRTAPCLVAIASLVAAGNAAALIIDTHYISPGNVFPNSGGVVARPYTYISDGMTPSIGAPSDAFSDTLVQRAFEAGATYWEQRFDDPFTLTVNYGFSGPPRVPIQVQGGVTTDYQWSGNRVIQANIYLQTLFDYQGTQYQKTWYLDPTPLSNDRYLPPTTFFADLGRGLINTGKIFAADPNFDPPAYTPIPGGSYAEVVTAAVHELTHALSMMTSTLSRLDPTHSTTSGNIVIPNGPFAGTTIPWDSGGGGHARLTPPIGDLITDGTFPAGEHRKLISEADALIIASIENFRRVNLDGRSYVALPDFADTSILTLNGAASTATAGSPQRAVLRLTPDEPGRAGSAFLTLPYTLNDHTAFSSEFTFDIGGVNGCGPQGSDGLAFVLQRQGPNALGNAGEGMGFGTNTFSPTTPAIAPSIAIAFDTHQNSFNSFDNLIEFVLNGDVQHPLNIAHAPMTLNCGTPLHAWVDYLPIEGLWNVFLSDTSSRPSEPDLSYVFNLANWVSNPLYFGFTAGTGDGFNYHDILDWQLYLRQLPEPAPLTLLGQVLLAIIWFGRRSSSGSGCTARTLSLRRSPSNS